jgi:hypothetical protein
VNSVIRSALVACTRRIGDVLLATRLVRPLKAALPHVTVDMRVFKGNVVLLQGEGDCVPCLHEGCDRHINSLSERLQYLPPSVVSAAAEERLHGANAAVCLSH